MKYAQMFSPSDACATFRGEKKKLFSLSFLHCRESLVYQDVLECQALLEELCLDQR